jgi:hypothetical protein
MVKEVLDTGLTEWRCRSYTARDLEDHYVLCGHRMLAKESKKVLDMMNQKYERNPTMSTADKEKRLRYAQRRRDWETRGMYPDAGQSLMEKYVSVCRD